MSWRIKDAEIKRLRRQDRQRRIPVLQSHFEKCDKAIEQAGVDVWTVEAGAADEIIKNTLDCDD